MLFNYRMVYLRSDFPAPVDRRGLTALAVDDLVDKTHACYGWARSQSVQRGRLLESLDRLAVGEAYECDDPRYFTLTITRAA